MMDTNGNGRRIFEGVAVSVVTALLVGAVSSFVSFKLLERDVLDLKSGLVDLKGEIKMMRNDLYVPKSASVLKTKVLADGHDN